MLNLFIKEKPDAPPSAVAQVPYERLDFSKSFSVMGENRNFLLLTIAFGLPFGSYIAIGTLVSNLFDPFGYSASELSFICLMLLGSGVFGAIIIGAFIDRTRMYKQTMIVLTGMIAVATAMVICTLTWFLDNESMFINWMEVLGFVGTGYIPLCLSYGSELTFPLQPALVNGTLTLVGSACSFLLSLLGAFMNHEGKHDYAFSEEELLYVRRRRSKSVMGIVVVAASIAFILSFFITEDLRRHKHS